MKTKLLSILTLLLCVCSGAWGDSVTIGITNTTTTTSKTTTTETLTGDGDNVTVSKLALSSSTQALSEYTTGDKAMNDGSGTSVYSTHTYKWNKNTGSKIAADLTEEYMNTTYPNEYVGFTFTVAEGKTFSISGIAAKLASSADHVFRIRIEDNSGNVLYTAAAKQIAKSSDNEQSITGLELNNAANIQDLPAGTYKVKAFLMFNSTGKYVVFTKLQVTGTVANSSSETFDITWNNGGHGTAPTLPTTGSTFQLPTMTEEGYMNTGWTADKAVTVNKETVTAGTVISVGTSVTISEATTFTGVWKTNSSFALTSGNEVEIAIGGNSTITSSGSAGTVTYESADESIATVSNEGVITGVAGGKTTITVTDPGSSSVAGGSATVTVLVPYSVSGADSYTFTIDQYSFSNSDNTKYYFKNGFTVSLNSGAACQYAAIESNTGIKYSHARAYTINVPSTVTVKYAVIKARNNYANENENSAANWGTVFGTGYSSETLPWSTEDPVEKEFVIASPSAGGTLTFQPGGNQWQAIITLYTLDYHAKYAVTYDAGEGLGSMDGDEVRGGSTITLPASTFTAPSEKGFAGWLCDIDDVVYAAGAEYTMTDAATTFTAQYEGVEGKMIIKAAPTSTSAATVTGAIGGTADVNLQSSGGSWKFGGDTHHIGVTLAGDWTFKTGDLLNVHITNVADISDTQIILYNKDRSISYETGVVGVLGDNMIALPAAFNGQNELYIYRLNASNKWNAFIDYIEVYRPDDNKVVTLNDKGFATYSYDKAFVVYGATAYKMALDIDGGTLTGTAVEKVPAGAGVLLKGEAGASVNILETSGATELTGNSLHGTTQADGTTVTKGSNDYYVLSGDTFKKFTGDAFTANKAYFEVDGTTVQGRVFSMIFDDGTTTGVNEELSMKNDDFASAPVYNLAGQRVAQPTKGLYIVNGKKVVVK